jgi:hypothetical protein
MRILRLSAFFVFAIVLCVSAQKTQPSPGQQPATAQSPDKNQPQPPPASSTQNLQNAKDQQRPAETPKPFRFDFVPSKPAPADQKFPTGVLDRGFWVFVVPATPELKSSTLKADASQPASQKVRGRSGNKAEDVLVGDERGDFDRGIYLGRALGASGAVCGSIMSYNFSQAAPDEMPTLESVTTCTPSNKVVPRRARGRDSEPSTPLLMRTVLSSD